MTAGVGADAFRLRLHPDELALYFDLQEHKPG